MLLCVTNISMPTELIKRKCGALKHKDEYKKVGSRVMLSPVTVVRFMYQF